MTLTEFLPSITWDDFLETRPCYTSAKLAALKKFASHKERWNVLDVLACIAYPARDRVWLALNQRFFTLRQFHELACLNVEHFIQRTELIKSSRCSELQHLLIAKKKWLNNELSENELNRTVSLTCEATTHVTFPVNQLRWSLFSDGLQGQSLYQAFLAAIEITHRATAGQENLTAIWNSKVKMISDYVHVQLERLQDVA